MSASAEEVVRLLTSIDTQLAAIAKHFGIGAQPATAPSRDVPEIAPDHDLDGRYGNQPIKAKDPRDWSGESQVGKLLSECPPEYLDLVAARLDYFASQEEDPKKQRYNRLDASRARGWAKRLRAGWKPPADAEPNTAAMVPEDEIAF